MAAFHDINTKLTFELCRFDIAHSRSRVIVVVKGDLPSREDMPTDLHDYIKTNTYLTWDDPWFWQKLRYSLPHKGQSHSCLDCIKRRRTVDQLYLLQNSRSVSSLAAPSSPSNGISSSLSGLRHNSVSPVST